jgi:hypothetical protein
MRTQIYIRVLNDEMSIRLLNEKTKIPGATIRPTKARRPGSDEVWWNWQSVVVEVDDCNAVEEAVLAMLLKYRSYFAVIKQHSGAEANVYLEVVHGSIVTRSGPLWV